MKFSLVVMEGNRPVFVSPSMTYQEATLMQNELKEGTIMSADDARKLKESMLSCGCGCKNG